jgi:hypothetical protein
MKRNGLIALVALLLVVLSGCGQVPQPDGQDQLERAFVDHSSNVPVSGEGTVSRILPDDRSGLPHQRFILRLASGRTILVEHNIDIAPRIDDIKAGDTIGFSGEYVWNDQGGLVHWTHHDPAGKHSDGWLKHNGRTYQ